MKFAMESHNLFAEDAVHDLNLTHNLLGAIFDDAGNVDQALSHYRESLKLEEIQKNVYGAAESRMNIAQLLLHHNHRLSDALEYARAALRDFESLGDRAAQDVQNTHALIALIQLQRGREVR